MVANSNNLNVRKSQPRLNIGSSLDDVAIKFGGTLVDSMKDLTSGKMGVIASIWDNNKTGAQRHRSVIMKHYSFETPAAAKNFAQKANKQLLLPARYLIVAMPVDNNPKDLSQPITATAPATHHTVRSTTRRQDLAGTVATLIGFKDYEERKTEAKNQLGAFELTPTQQVKNDAFFKGRRFQIHLCVGAACNNATIASPEACRSLLLEAHDFAKQAGIVFNQSQKKLLTEIWKSALHNGIKSSIYKAADAVQSGTEDAPTHLAKAREYARQTKTPLSKDEQAAITLIRDAK